MSSEDPRDQPDTSNGRSNEPVEDLLPAYILDALDDNERQRVEAALAASPDFRLEHHRYQEVMDAFLEDLTPEEPPPRLLARIEESASTTSRRPVSLASRLPRVLAAAAAALILVLAGTVAYLIGEVRERDRELAALEAAAQRPGTDFTQPLVWSPILVAGNGSQVEGYFCRTADGSVGWIIVEGMHQPAGEIFQLWLVDGDQIVDGGMFATDEEGRGFGVVRSDVPVHTFSQIWITAEPPGGSLQPTNEPDVTAPIV